MIFQSWCTMGCAQLVLGCAQLLSHFHYILSFYLCKGSFYDWHLTGYVYMWIGTKCLKCMKAMDRPRYAGIHGGYHLGSGYICVKCDKVVATREKRDEEKQKVSTKLKLLMSPGQKPSTPIVSSPSTPAQPGMRPMPLLLSSGELPSLTPRTSRRAHRQLRCAIGAPDSHFTPAYSNLIAGMNYTPPNTTAHPNHPNNPNPDTRLMYVEVGDWVRSQLNGGCSYRHGGIGAVCGSKTFPANHEEPVQFTGHVAELELCCEQNHQYTVANASLKKVCVPEGHHGDARYGHHPLNVRSVYANTLIGLDPVQITLRETINIANYKRTTCTCIKYCLRTGQRI
jgi:hypothetical protein